MCGPGWTDPILANAFGAGSLAAKVRLGFAWPNATAPMELFNKSEAQMSHKDDGLIFERNITTGKTEKYDLPLQARPASISSPKCSFRAAEAEVLTGRHWKMHVRCDGCQLGVHAKKRSMIV